MDAHHRFERRSLRDVLIDQGVLDAALADELISSARESNEAFGCVLVEAGHLSAWDLAKLVATHYQMPYLPLAGFHYDKDLIEGVSTAALHQYVAVPVGHFGRSWSFAVVEPPSRDCIASLQEACGSGSLFFFVAEVPEVERLLRDNIKVVDTTNDKSWHEIFDTGDRNVFDEGDEDE